MNTYLEDVPSGKEFFIGTKSIKNLHGLLFEFRSIPDETYGLYVGKDHNYFSDWIEHVIANKKLADELRPIISRKEATAVLERNIEMIKRGNEKVAEPKKEKQEEKQEVKQEVKKEEKQKEKKELPPISLKTDHVEKKEVLESKKDDTSILLEKVSQDEKEIKEFLWKHFKWDMAKEFMYGLAVGILIGFVLAKVFIQC